MNTDDILKGRLKDLANRAYQHNIYTFTNFLSQNDMEIFYQLKESLNFISSKAFGGAELCDRVILGFGTEEMTGYPIVFPISIIKVSPVLEKFSDELSHRDFLGALMNLGVEREMLGDIIVKAPKEGGKKHTAYVFCVDTMADYIMDNLTKVKHTVVKCTLLPEADLCDLSLEKQELSVIAASLRIDAVIASITKLSRSQVVTLFREKKICLNGRIFENNSYMLKDDDILSIRGYGKYHFLNAGGETKKGRTYIHIEKYI